MSPVFYPGDHVYSVSRNVSGRVIDKAFDPADPNLDAFAVRLDKDEPPRAEGVLTNQDGSAIFFADRSDLRLARPMSHDEWLDETHRQ